MTRPEEPSRPGENFEPYEEMRQIPIGVIMFAVALALWGGVLLYQSSYAVAVGRADETVLSPQSEQGLGLTGAKLFEANCTTCHQPGAAGQIALSRRGTGNRRQHTSARHRRTNQSGR